MNVAVFQVMLLGLLRDRGALAMGFLIPAAFFIVFATVFAAASGVDMRVQLAIADEAHSATSETLVATLRRLDVIDASGDRELTAAQVRDRVRRGSADVGLIIRDAATVGRKPVGESLVIVGDPVRGVAMSLLAGQLQRMQAPSDLADASAGGGGPAAVEHEYVAGMSADLNHVAYYAGAVAVLFLLFSSVHGAVTLLEEEEAGILDRVLAGPAGAATLVNGKFLFLVGQGVVQVAVIFVVAWLLYGIDLPGHVVPWSLATLAASAAAAGLALALVTACTTRRQAQTLANVAILILSAIGGSMVPRFLMPPLLQDLGALTPNAWALEAYSAIFWRDEPIASLGLPIGILLGAGMLGLALAQRFARRLQTL